MTNYYYTNYQSPEYRSVAGSADAPQPAAVRVESVAFPGVYLCMGGTVAEFDMDGAGWAACEYGAQSVLLSVQTGPAADVVALAYNAVLPVVASDLSPAIRNTGVFLRMDAVGFTGFTSVGAGTVNCQYGVGPWEEFRLERQPDGATFAIASVAFPGVYLRMDARGIKEEAGSHGGTVNCQYGAGPWERFLVHRLPTF